MIGFDLSSVQLNQVVASFNNLSIAPNYCYPTVNYSLSPEFSQLEPLESIVQEMDRRSTNLTYGIGVGLGRFIEEKVSPLFRGAKSLFDNVSSVFVSQSAYNDQDLLKAILQHQCYQYDDAKWASNTQHALIARDNDDESAMPDIRAHDEALMLKLSKYYHVHEYETTSISKLCETIESVSELGNIDLAIINGHGSHNTLSLDVRKPYSINMPSYFFYANIPNSKDLSCLDSLGKKAKIILESCSTGSHRDTLNIQKLITFFAPGRNVYAPEQDIIKGSLEVIFEPNFRVFGLIGLNATGEKEITQLIEADTENINLIYKMVKKNAPLKEYEVVSSENASWCTEAMGYFRMKRYCDEMGIKPSAEDIQKCKEDKVQYVCNLIRCREGNGQNCTRYDDDVNFSGIQTATFSVGALLCGYFLKKEKHKRDAKQKLQPIEILSHPAPSYK